MIYKVQPINVSKVKRVFSKRVCSCCSLGIYLLLQQACGNVAKSSSTPASGSNLEIPTLIEGSATSRKLALASDDSSDNIDVVTKTTGVQVESSSMSLEDCDSGLVGDKSPKGKSIRVYLNDKNCVVKLNSFLLNGKTYLPSGEGAVPFTSWTEGNKAVFVSGSDLVNVEILKQLSSPIQKTDLVSYKFSTTTTTPTPVKSAAKKNLVLSGQDAPNFKIAAGGSACVTITGDGAGVFTFTLNCTAGTMTEGVDPRFNTFCSDTLPGGKLANGDSGVDVGSQTTFSYKLVDDVNGNGTLSMDQAQSAFAEGGETIVDIEKDLLPDSSGFTTKKLAGPIPITAHPNMILVLQAKSTISADYSSDPTYSSYQYFPIRIAPLAP